MSSVAVSPNFGDTKAIAKLTGLSPRTIRRHSSSGRLRSYKVEGRVLFDFREVDAFIRSSHREATAPPSPALGPDGRAVDFPATEARGRVGAALAALRDEGDDAADQVEGWGALRAALAIGG